MSDTKQKALRGKVDSLLHDHGKPLSMMKKVFASEGGSVRPATRCQGWCTSAEQLQPDQKIGL